MAERLIDQMTRGLKALDIEVALAQPLTDYVNLLHKWNKPYNLTAVRRPEDMVIKHVLDSLALVPYLTSCQRLCDCLLYTSPSPRDMRRSRMPSSA